MNSILLYRPNVKKFCLWPQVPVILILKGPPRKLPDFQKSIFEPLRTLAKSADVLF